MNKIRNVDILEDLYLQYEDMEIALKRYLELFNLKIISSIPYDTCDYKNNDCVTCMHNKCMN